MHWARARAGQGEAAPLRSARTRSARFAVQLCNRYASEGVSVSAAIEPQFVPNVCSRIFTLTVHMYSARPAFVRMQRVIPPINIEPASFQQNKMNVLIVGQRGNATVWPRAMQPCDVVHHSALWAL